MRKFLTVVCCFFSFGYISLVCAAQDTNDTKEDKPPRRATLVDSSSPPALSRKVWSWRDYGSASIAGATRGLAGFPLEHPFDRVKTTQQASPVALSGTKTALAIYQQEGVRGFYKGGIPNGSRYILKPMYRYPLMFFLPNAYEDILPASAGQKNPYFKKALTGVTLASLEVYFICPLERLKVALMTSGQEKNPLLNFMRQSKGHMGKELFRGLNALFPKQIVSWTSFLLADVKMKELCHRWTGTPLYEELSFWPLMGAGTVVGIVNTAVTLPFDYVKTHLQQRSAHDTGGLAKAVKQLYARYGATAFYSGWRTRMLHYILHGIFTVTILEKLEKH